MLPHGVTKHWCVRVRERVGPVDPVVLAERLLAALRAEDYTSVEFVARVNRGGCRLFRFSENGKQHFALVDTERMQCVTVLPPGFVVSREGKRRITLREKYL